MNGARNRAGAGRWPGKAAGAGVCACSLIGALLLALFCALGGGCTNDPFDPASVPNQRPVARIFVSPVEGDTLDATSYFRRTFRWSGSDADGHVVDYVVSIKMRHSPSDTTRGVPPVWRTTTSTDTTITFTTDDLGHAAAMLRVACRDDRGAVSETASVYIPLRNFPPVINFQANFDTVRWSYGAANFRLFAVDLDGNETMDDSLRYKLDTADSSIVRVLGEPGADPALCWVKRRIDDVATGTFEIDLTGVPPGPARRLTVTVGDEARADGRLDWTWEVKEARGPVLLVDDSGPFSDELYYAAMDSIFGVRLDDPAWPHDWSVYDVSAGLPDRLWVLRETFRQFDVVLWYTGGGMSLNLLGAVTPLTDYLAPPGLDPPPAGRLLLCSRAVTGAYTTLPPGFVTNVLGIGTTSAPANAFSVPVGKKAVNHQRPTLPAITSIETFPQTQEGVGVTVRAGAQAIYKMEYHAYDTRPPYEPFVCVRRPLSTSDPYARSIVLTIQLEYFDRPEAIAALRALLTSEMGVAP